MMVEREIKVSQICFMPSCAFEAVGAADEEAIHYAFCLQIRMSNATGNRMCLDVVTLSFSAEPVSLSILGKKYADSRPGEWHYGGGSAAGAEHVRSESSLYFLKACISLLN